MIYILVSCFFSFTVLAAPMGIQSEWSQISDPLLMSVTYESRLSLLPSKARLQGGSRFWSGDYWPLNKGNINYRWNAQTNHSFHAEAPQKNDLFNMSSKEIAQLSPSEKFDLLNGQYHYPLTKEVKGISDTHALDWEGICHGWAPASMNHDEPTPKVLTNPDGIQIPFGSADIKALLSYFYAYPYQVENTYQVGRRCFTPGVLNNQDDCKEDLNAGAFHLILTNKVGLNNESFIADLDRYNQIWNHPIVGYQTRVLNEYRGASSDSAPGTSRLVKVKTKIFYVDGSGHFWETGHQKITSKEFKYILELNIRGEIIGGDWISRSRPDFLWIKERPPYFSGAFYRLKELLND